MFELIEIVMFTNNKIYLCAINVFFRKCSLLQTKIESLNCNQRIKKRKYLRNVLKLGKESFFTNKEPGHFWIIT